MPQRQSRSMRRAVKYAERILNAFRFHNSALPHTYDRRFVSVYNKYDVPVANYVPRHIYMSLLADEVTLHLYLPCFTQLPDFEQQRDWRARLPVGTTVMSMNTAEGPYFEMPEESPLARLARQYDVALPKRMDRFSIKEATRLFNEVQAAVYAPAGLDLYFPYDNPNPNKPRNLGEIDYDTFLMSSLFAQAHGGALTAEQYKLLFPQHLDNMLNQMGMDPDTFHLNFEPGERERAHIILFNAASLLSDPEQVKGLAKVPYSMLKDMYPVSDTDTRFATVF